MANAKKDGNGTPTLIAALNTDGTTIVRVKVNSSTNSLEVADGVTGTNYGTVNAEKDGNGVPTMIAVSSADGVTPIEVYTDSSGNLLIQTT